ncbi:PorT family protein [Paludibacter sp. 221]|uniref:type IX secretion/gliding motility protein PorT/SprT n=1 Tax=Paludibacter sp. 221 TaxID=2302939 RepID=UPI0013D848C7|nr:outer membrane beta-barrel protein [Paludibacter sp. 221]NDV47110.1 PorT family protein [Paludibacter sp. 221]
MRQKLSKKHLVFILFIIPFLPLKSQGNLPYYDDRPIHFGFSLGINTMDFGVSLSHQAIDDLGNVYLAETSNLIPGFSAGIITDLRLNRYLNLRFTPTINFSERRLTYRLEEGTEKEKQDVFSIPLMLPLHLKYSAERVHNFRPYILAGGGGYIDFARDHERNILLKPFDYYLEFGFGCDIYFSFFKFAPELKFAIGFNNMLTPSSEREAGSYDRKYVDSISKLTTRMLTLTFNFE